MKVEKEMKYEAPEVEVLEVMVESGFEGSVPGGSSEIPAPGGSDWE